MKRFLIKTILFLFVVFGLAWGLDFVISKGLLKMEDYRFMSWNDMLCNTIEADVVILAEIYAARERNTVGISSMDLVNEIPGSVYCATLPDVTRCLKEVIQEGDIVLTVGAGDIFRAGEALLADH